MLVKTGTTIATGVLCLATIPAAGAATDDALARSGHHHKARPTAQQVLLARPLAPRDINLLSPVIYPKASAMRPAAGSAPSESAVAAQLHQYLDADLPHDSNARQAAELVFNSNAAKAKISSPTLRAALAALEGTLARPAINYVINAQTPDGNPKIISIQFVPPGQLSSPFNVAEVHDAQTADPDQQVILFNSTYQAESPFLFLSTMAHEPLHQDPTVTNYEEAVNWTLDRLVYLGQLRRHPSLARTGTELSRRLNSNALLRLNSGVGSQLGLYKSNRNRPLFPGSTKIHVTSWWQESDNGDTASSPGNALLATYLHNIHHGHGAPCSASRFDTALLHCIDRERDGPLSAADLLAAAKAMRLNTDVERARSVSLVFKKGAAHGRVRSAAKPCQSRQRVILYREHGRKTDKAASAKADRHGHFRFTVKGKSATYQAKLPQRALPGVGVCRAAASKATKF
jgi:hypothetical protein